jgi:hypothetical protein
MCRAEYWRMVALLVGLAGLVTVWMWALCIAAARADRSARRLLSVCETCEGTGTLHISLDPQRCPECRGMGRTPIPPDVGDGPRPGWERRARVVL